MSEIFVIPAGSRITPSFPARFITVKDISVPGASFIVRAKGTGFDIDEEMEKGSKLRDLPEVVNDWEFHNKSANDITVTLKIGLVYYDEQKIVGDIDAVTRTDNLTLDNNRYMGSAGGANFISEYSMNVLWNPVGSGVNGWLDKMMVMCNDRIPQIFIVNDVTGFTDLNSILFPQGGRNKDLSIAAKPKLGIWTHHAVATVGTKYMSLPFNYYGAQVELNMEESPMKIPPGTGLMCAPDIVNNRCLTEFEWHEVAI